jgi:menaquinone-dependent protoporphyrinogen oxidase
MDWTAPGVRRRLAGGIESEGEMRVLISAASKHGATAGIGDHIGETLRHRGFDVTVAEPDQAKPEAGYDGIVLGSGVYAGHWLKDAKNLATRIAACDPAPPVWVFSSGPLGDPPKPDEEPVDVASIVEATAPVEHRIFAGKIDKSELGFGERAIMVAVRAPDGDFRDWDEIATWANEIADALEPAQEAT